MRSLYLLQVISKTPKVQKFSARKLNISRPNRAEWIARQYIWPFNFSEMTGRLHKCFSPAYTAPELEMRELISKTLQPFLVKQLQK